MSEKRSDPRDEKIIDAFSELLDLDLLPRSIDEAEEALRAAALRLRGQTDARPEGQRQREGDRDAAFQDVHECEGHECSAGDKTQSSW